MTPPKRVALSVLAAMEVILVLSANAEWQHTPAGTAYAYTFAADSSGERMFLGLVRGGLWRSVNSGNDWEPINHLVRPDTWFWPLSLDIVDRTADTVIARMMGIGSGLLSHVWYSFNHGEHWLHFPEDLQSDNTGDFMQVWRRQHHVWLHLSSFRFHRSTDYGQSWGTYLIDNRFAGRQFGLFQDPHRDSTLYFAGSYLYDSTEQRSHGGLGRSDDLGETWRPILDLNRHFGVSQGFVTGMLRLSNDDLLALADALPMLWPNGNVIVSTDDGSSWTRVNGGLPDRFMPMKVIEDATQPGTLFLAGAQKYGLYWSHDFGRAWQRCLNGLPSNVAFVNDVFQNRFDGVIYVCVTGYGVYRSADHGLTWDPVAMPRVGPIGVFGATDETVFVRDDGYRQWRLDGSNLEWEEMSVPLAPDTLVLMRPVCYQQGDTLVSALWKRAIATATDQLQMIYSYDDGQSWQMDPFLDFLPERYFRVHRGESRTRFVTWDSEHLYWSENLGHDWHSSLVPSLCRINAEIAQNDSFIYVTTFCASAPALRVFRTSDNGRTWTDLLYPGPSGTSSTVPTLMGDDLFINGDGRCWHWASGLWDERGVISTAQELTFLITVPMNPPILFGLGFDVNQAWISSDSGWTWEERLIELPFGDQSFGFTDLQYDAFRERIWAVAGIGVCYINVSELSSNDPLHFKPADFTLLSVYPNPFNSEARIRFDLDHATDVTLRVYDLAGRLVQTLTDDAQNAGRHEILWDGRALTSGTYFVRLHIDQAERTQKVLLLR